MVLFFNNNAGAITAIATMVLVIVTIIYVWHTSRLSSTASNQFKLQRQQHILENRPWIYVSSAQFYKSVKGYKDYKVIKFNLENSGKIPGKIEDFPINLIRNGEIIDKDEWQDKNVVFPGQKEFLQSWKFNEDIIEDDIIEMSIIYYSALDNNKKKQFSLFQVYKREKGSLHLKITNVE